MIGLSMIDGKKENIAIDQTIPTSKTPFGILLVGLVVAFGIYIFKNYDGQTRSLQFFGTTLQLSESEEAKGEKGDDD
jgi:hypothetical protein